MIGQATVGFTCMVFMVVSLFLVLDNRMSLFEFMLVILLSNLTYSVVCMGLRNQREN